MSELKCPFSAPLVSETHQCEHAQQVVRRGGAEIDCQSEQSHQSCSQLFDRLKQAALPAFGVEDDLLSMPHSVLQKIQYGGLSGLSELLEKQEKQVKNIAALVNDVLARYQSLDNIPCDQCVSHMVNYKLRRRR